MTHLIDIQDVADSPLPVSEDELVLWSTLALRDQKRACELTIRCVDAAEMIGLNHQYRDQNKPTNVLAFPSTVPDLIPLDYKLLGDVIICPTVLVTESVEQNKSLKEHWALIVIHGVLHLLGFDHIKEDDAATMQGREIELLAQLGYANPYEIEEINLE
jgi:probable rRNA maturation factor